MVCAFIFGEETAAVRSEFGAGCLVILLEVLIMSHAIIYLFEWLFKVSLKASLSGMLKANFFYPILFKPVFFFSFTASYLPINPISVYC